jgi:prepilin-type N-terminal cleavage/methylation domain-containing protein
MQTRPTRRTARSRQSGSRSAFTLIEMTIVVVIAGLMVTLAIPRIDTTKYRADAIAQIVRTTLQYAQRQAITRQHDMIVSFDTSGERIRTFWDANNNGQLGTGERTTWRGLDVGVLFTDPSVAGVSGVAIQKPVNGANISTLAGWPSVVFHRDGSVSTDAEIYVSVAAHGPPWYRAITLTQSTGRTEWYRLNTSTNKWIRAGQ